MQHPGMPNSQMQMHNGIPNMHQNQFQQPFPGQQTSGQMQPSPMRMPPQGQVPQGSQGPMGNQVPNRVNPMPTGPPRPGQLQGMPTGMPQQMASGIPQFTQEENQRINQIAQQMAQAFPQAEMASLRQKVSQAPEVQRIQMQQQKIDPLIWYFRRQATTRFMHMRRQQQQSQQQQHQFPIGQGPGNTPHGQFPGQSPVVGSGNQPQPFNSGQGGPGSVNPQFIGLQHQQQAGLQQQQQGITVVPASQPNQGAQQKMNMAGGPQQKSNTPVKSAQNQQQMAQQNQGGARMTPTQSQNPQMQRPPSAANLTGMPNGLHGPGGQAAHQQSPALPNINKAADIQRTSSQGPMQQRQSQPQNQTSTQNSTAPTTQQGQSGQSGSNQTSMNPNQPGQMQPGGGGLQRPQFQRIVDAMPAQMRHNLLKLPQEKQPQAAMQFWQRLQAMKRQQAQAQGRPPGQMLGQPPSSGNSQMQQGQATNTQAQVNGQMNQQPSQGSNHNISSNPQASLSQQTRPTNGLPNQSVQGQQGQKAVPNMQGRFLALNDATIRELDKKPFPRAILNSTNSISQHLPQHVKTWGELKDWAQQNQASLGQTIPERLKQMQSVWFQSWIKNFKNSNGGQQPQQMQGQPPNMGTQNPAIQNQQGPAPPAPMGPVAPNTGSNITAIPSNFPRPSQQEIESIRKGVPKVAHLSDDQIVMIIYKRKATMAMQHKQAQQAMQAQQGQRLNGPTPGSNGQNLGQMQSRAPNQVQATAQNQAKPNKDVSQQGNAILQKPQNQAPATQKGVKRSQSDDVVEVPPPAPAASSRPMGPSAQAQFQQGQGQSNLVQQRQSNEVPSKAFFERMSQTFFENIKKNPLFAAADEAKMRRVAQLRTEIVMSQVESQRVPGDPQTQQKMKGLCDDLSVLMMRLDIVAPVMYCLENCSEQTVRDILQVVS